MVGKENITVGSCLRMLRIYFVFVEPLLFEKNFKAYLLALGLNRTYDFPDWTGPDTQICRTGSARLIFLNILPAK